MPAAPAGGFHTPVHGVAGLHSRHGAGDDD
jgi:hypothetical protein